MTKYVDTFYRIATRAYMYDKTGNLYTGEQLMLALLLHSKGGSRNMDGEKYVGRLLDDPNQKDGQDDRRRSKQSPKPRAPRSSE